MKLFFSTLPRNLLNCFRGRMLMGHASAIIFTFVCVTSGFDWRYFLSTRDPLLYSWMFPSAPIGGLVPLALPLLLLIAGSTFKKTSLTRTGWAIGQAELLGSLISSGYKAFTARAHPAHLAGKDISRVFHFGFLRGGVFWGWPSSHTTIAFAMAVTVWKLFPQQRWLGTSAIIYAFYIGFGVSMTIHWFSDFAAGALIGTVIGIVVGKSFGPSPAGLTSAQAKSTNA